MNESGFIIKFANSTNYPYYWALLDNYMSKHSSTPTLTPVYLIKPKYIFKNPFLKYDLQNPTNR